MTGGYVAKRLTNDKMRRMANVIHGALKVMKLHDVDLGKPYLVAGNEGYAIEVFSTTSEGTRGKILITWNTER